MITLSIAYNDNCEQFTKDMKDALTKYPLVKLVTFHENLLKERKKAFKLKGGFSARQAPFAVLHDEDKTPIKAFYSEAGTCTVDKILETLNTVTPYDSKI